ncbi:MAG TPA: arabinofuranosidase catalytic domain-containing protein, partial [Polyangiaceae bacterium]
MNISRPALAVFTSVLASAACGGSEVPPGGTGGTGTIGGTGATAGTGTSGNPSGGTPVGGSPAAGSGTGGSTAGSATAGTNPGGGSGTGGTGGTAGSAGSGGAGGGAGGGGGSGGVSSNTEGPCDIYLKGGTPCVAAYSTTRRLLSTYAGPLYQVRSGSNAMNNTASGGMLHDIPQKDGFADIAAQATAC